MSREAGLAAVRQRRWGEASELLGELAASGQADAAALDIARLFQSPLPDSNRRPPV
jgi:hypothetical protein